MYKISEFANMVGLPQSTIRFYEKYGLLPVKRHSNGYRYYTPSDAFLVNAFRVLLQYGFTVEQAIEMLNEKQAGEKFRSSLKDQKEELIKQMDLMSYRLGRLDHVLDLLNYEQEEAFQLADIDDIIYVHASYGRDFRVSVENAETLTKFVELLSITSYSRIIRKTDFDSDKDYVEPSYITSMPVKEAYRLGEYNKAQVQRLTLGRSIKFQRKKTREESVKKVSFASLFHYMEANGHRMRGDILLYPTFLNLDGKGSDIETLIVPIYE